MKKLYALAVAASLLLNAQESFAAAAAVPAICVSNYAADLATCSKLLPDQAAVARCNAIALGWYYACIIFPYAANPRERPGRNPIAIPVPATGATTQPYVPAQ